MSGDIYFGDDIYTIGTGQCLKVSEFLLGIRSILCGERWISIALQPMGQEKKSKRKNCFIAD